ncbi:hypothetical protein AKJ16_DCAP26398, partial [Drosera capensis]
FPFDISVTRLCQSELLLQLDLFLCRGKFRRGALQCLLNILIFSKFLMKAFELILKDSVRCGDLNSSECFVLATRNLQASEMRAGTEHASRQ